MIRLAARGLGGAVRAAQAVLWLVAQRTKNAGIVDVGWALTFTLVVALFGAARTGALAADRAS